MRRVRGALLPVLAGAVLVTAACTADPAAPAAPAPSRAGRPSVVATPTATGCTQPLVLATHRSREPLQLSVARARAWVRGEDRPRGVVVLRAGEVDPRLRPARVGGVDPLRRPASYPLQVPADACPPRPSTLTVVGDVMLGRRVAEAAAGDPGRQLRATAPRLRMADLTVGNLESTLSRAGAPTQGGDSFAAPPAAAPALVDAGFDAVSLANNHSGDFGPLALRQTVRRLKRAGLAGFGAGPDLASARSPAVLRVRGTSFGFLGFNAIGETPEAGPGRTGAVSVSMPPRTGPLDRRELDRFLRDVRALNRRVDVVVVLPHWGTQYTNRPESMQRRVARDAGGGGCRPGRRWPPALGAGRVDGR